MNAQSFDVDSWYLAMTLKERLRSRQQCDWYPIECATAASNYRVQLWRSRQPFDTDKQWAKRLAADGLTSEGLLGILSEPAWAVRSRFSEIPEWMGIFREAFRQSPAPSEMSDETEAFTRVAGPLIEFGARRLESGVEQMLAQFSGAPFEREIVREWRANIIAQLGPMLVRTMALELNVNRLEGALTGEKPEDRFHSFVASLGDADTALRILEEYPVLARLLTEVVIRSMECTLEVLQRLCGDWEEIRPVLFPGQETGRLTRLKGNIGDKHRGGRAVLILEFESAARVVYKPRSLTIDRHFQDLLGWLNEHGAPQPLRVLKVMDRGNYGWVEFVTAQSCAYESEVRRFYQRQGAYLALLYALDATDFHNENLLAAGEYPLLVDLEALFHPHFRDCRPADALVVAERELSESVQRVGLLPVRMWGDAEAEGVDLSGLSTVGEQMSPFSVPEVEGGGTDEMRFVLKRAVIPVGGHQPSMEGKRIDLEDYSAEILDGFTHMYRLLMRHREELLREGGPLDRFSEDEVRVILLPTQTYGLLLHESFHPDFLRNALDRDRLFDGLWAWSVSRPELETLMTAQIRDLSNNDVPIFTTKPGTRDLWNSSWERFSDFLEECPMASVRRKLLRMSEEDLARHIWVIGATMATLKKETDKVRPPKYLTTKREGTATQSRLLAAAKKAADWLATQTRRGEDDATWIGLTLGQDRRWSLAPASIDLYDGLPGIALFLGEIGAVTGEFRYRELAEQAINGLLRMIEKNSGSITSIGGFAGWGGLVYAFTRLGDLWQREDLRQSAEDAAARIPELIERDEVLDIIGGAAGSIGALMGLYRRTASRAVLNAAVQCGEHLLQRAKPCGEGIAWPAPFANGKALTGFSHGVAGMAWALQQLADASGERRFAHGVAGALAYERSLFDPRHNNWPDLREDLEGGTGFTMAWCHGAPGIGLARLGTLKEADGIARAEIAAALQATMAAGPGQGHCLCHGDLGNLDLVLEAARRVNGLVSAHDENRFAAAVLADIEGNSWRCGLSFDVLSPGLMTGVAGIGYQLLRLAYPERVPSVLLFDHRELQLAEQLSESRDEIAVC